MNQLPENSLRIYGVTLVTSYLGLTLFYSNYSQDGLNPVFNKGQRREPDFINKGQDVSLCEFVHRTSTCFRCYPSNQ